MDASCEINFGWTISRSINWGDRKTFSSGGEVLGERVLNVCEKLGWEKEVFESWVSFFKEGRLNNLGGSKDVILQTGGGVEKYELKEVLNKSFFWGSVKWIGFNGSWW